MVCMDRFAVDLGSCEDLGTVCGQKSDFMADMAPKGSLSAAAPGPAASPVLSSFASLKSGLS